MKKLLLLIVLFTLNSQLQAQEWFPVGAKWHYGWAELACVSPFVSQYYVDIYRVEKDTIVLGKKCSKIIRESIQPFNHGREVNFVFDSANKIYYYPPYEFDSTRNEWSLLYDFTKEKHDTIWYENMIRIDFFSGDTSMYYIVVDTTFTKLINGDTLKHYSGTSQVPKFSWIDFGSQATEIIGGGPIIIGDHWAGGCLRPQGLRCYEDSILGFYQHPRHTLDCDTSYSINTSIDDPLAQRQVTVFPNPANNMINIAIKQNQIFNTSNTQIAKFNLFDLNGKLIETFQLSAPNSTLDISNLQPGIYFWEFSSEKGRIRDKLIIQ